MELKGLAEQVEAVRSGQVRVQEVVSWYLERAARHESLNAFTHLQTAEAAADASRLDAALAAGEDPGPLTGAVIALKDLIDEEGQITTAGSSFYRRKANTSATIVSRLHEAGAVILGRTGLHEFAYGFSSENDWFGPVRNPWDQETSPGGSSGGSAVAAAANLASAAIGTDTGGSVRVPAALCGVVGLKVTHGRVPLTGVFPLAGSLDTVGPLARSIEDAALVYLVIAGHDAADPWSVSASVEAPALEGFAIEGLVAGVPERWIENAPMTRQIAESFDHTLRGLEGLGVKIETVNEPELEPPGMAYELMSPEVAVVHRDWLRDPDRRYGPEVEGRLSKALEVTLDQYVAAQAWRAKLRDATRRVFDRVEVLLTPTVPATRKQIGNDRMHVEGNDVHYRFVLSWFSYLVNSMGVPAVAVPIADEDSPPASLQVVGRWWSEARLLEIGHVLERAGLSRTRPPLLP